MISLDYTIDHERSLQIFREKKNNPFEKGQSNTRGITTFGFKKVHSQITVSVISYDFFTVNYCL